MIITTHAIFLSFSFFFRTIHTHLCKRFREGKNLIYKASLQVGNIDDNLMIPTLVNDDIDIVVDDDDDDSDGTPDQTVPAGVHCKRLRTKQYDDDIMKRRVCAKRSDN